MKKISQDQLPRHVCETINDAPTSYLLQEGKGKRKKILAIGESPALDGWILSGKAFYTKAGKLVPSGKRFNELFEPLGFSIEEISFTELCKCVLGTERRLLASCAPKCRSHLQKQIEALQPSLIIVLGKHTLDIFNNTIQQNIPAGMLSEQHIGGKHYVFLTLYHPSPINPRSRALNQAIVQASIGGLKKLCSAL